MTDTSATETLVLARAIVWKSIVLRIRYAFTTATNVVAIYAFFLLLVYGSRTIAPTAIVNSRSGVVGGCFLLLTATVAYTSISGELLREARWGTLEQLFISPVGFDRIILLTTSVNAIVSLAYGIVLLALLAALIGETLVIKPTAVVCIGLLSLGPAIGVGFMLSGVALVFERIENIFRIVQFGFVVFVVTPVDGSLTLKLIPLSLSGELLRRSMDAGVPLWELSKFDVGLLFGTSIAYGLIGYTVFQYGRHIARSNGRFGGY